MHRLSLTWEPWRLLLKVKSGAGPWGAAIAAAPQITLGTNQLAARLGSQDVPFSAAVYFAADSIEFTVIPATIAAGITALADIPRKAGLPPRSVASYLEGASARISHSLINYMSRLLLLAAQEYPIDTGSPAIGRLFLTKLAASSTSDDHLNISGNLKNAAGLTFAIEEHNLGKDLAVEDVSVSPLGLPTCSGNIVERAKCEAQNALIRGAALAAGNALTGSYHGRPLRISATLILQR